MIGRVLRVLIGLGFASLAAGLTIVLFIFTPVELLEGGGVKAAEAGLLAMAAARQLALFAAPFALLAAGLGEWRRFGGWSYYALTAMGIAGIGFLAYDRTRAAGEAIASYALIAFVATGLVAGTVYWLLSGRFAARRGDYRPGAELEPRPQHPAEGVSERPV